MHKLVEYRAKHVELSRPGDNAVQSATDKTRLAMEAILKTKIAASRPSEVSDEVMKTNKSEAKYIRYTPHASFVGKDSDSFNSGAKQRIIRMVEAPVDPMEPPKFEHKKVPAGPPSPPTAVMHSPPRKVTVKDQLDWKIPPCISNWKNARGFTIPLDKRLAADGRGLIQPTISDNHAKFAEALYIADRTARDELEMRNKVTKQYAKLEKQREDERLRKLAAEVHAERAGLSKSKTTTASDDQSSDEDDEDDVQDRGNDRSGETREDREARKQREEMRRDRLRERKRDLRMEALGKKSKTSRDMDRDVSERVALGMAVGKVSDASNQYDARLFNQSQGMDAGFGEEDDDTVYTKSLIPEKSGGIYRPKKDDVLGSATADEEYNKLKNSSRFKPDKGFAGVDGSAGQRGSGPVMFEKKTAPKDDPFGLDAITNDIRSGDKRKRIDGDDATDKKRKY